MGEFINVLVSKGKSNLIPEKDNLYGQFVGEWDFEWVDNQGTTGERHVPVSYTHLTLPTSDLV